VDNGSLILGTTIPIVTALIGIWYSRQYLIDSYRRKILKIIFLRYIIKYPLKNGKYKEVFLYELLDKIYLWKFFNRFLFSIVFILLIWVFGYYKSFNSMFITFDLFAIIYFYFLIILFLFINLKHNKENLNEININKYIIKRSFHIINSDFIFEWFLLTIVFFIILFENFSLSVLSTNWVFVLEIFLGYTSFLILPVFFQYVYPLEKYYLKHNDLENVIFKDFNSIINISMIVHINGETIKGKIIGIGDELVLINDKTESHSKIYIPWENIVFFEVVNN